MRCIECQRRKRSLCHPSPNIAAVGHGRYHPPRASCIACRHHKKACSFGARAKPLSPRPHTPTVPSDTRHVNQERPAPFQSISQIPFSLFEKSSVPSDRNLKEATYHSTRGGLPAPKPSAVPNCEPQLKSMAHWPRWGDNSVVGQHAWRDWGWG